MYIIRQYGGLCYGVFRAQHPFHAGLNCMRKESVVSAPELC